MSRFLGSLMLGDVYGTSEPVRPLPTRTPTSPPTAPPAPALARPAGDAPALPAGLPSATVACVVDGDIVDVTLGGQVVRVRLIGIDVPEVVDPRRPVECFGREASARAHELLEADPSQGDADRYGRALRNLIGRIAAGWLT